MKASMVRGSYGEGQLLSAGDDFFFFFLVFNLH